jgi:hypothetical protein
MKKIAAAIPPRSNPRSLLLRKGGQRMPRQIQSVSSNRPAAHFLLSKTIEFLLSAGEPPEHLALELGEQAERVRGRLRLLRTADAKRVQDSRERRCELDGVVHDWHREAAYTNQDGDPRQITQRSLRTLVGKRFPRQKISANVRWMFENGVVNRTSRGMIALVGGRTLLTRTELLDRAAAFVPQYLRTELRNTYTPDPYSRDVNRAARVFYLPEKYVPLWRAVARERAQAFLEGVDNWLEDHARRNDVGPVREVAMHCFAYTGDSRSPKAASTNTRRLRVRG